MSTRLPKDSLIVVSGANGYIGSHTVDQVLALGYRVRGTVRNVAKNAWLQEYFDKKYGTGRFELIEVSDFSASGAWDEAIKGASGFAHTASDVSFRSDPEETITPVVKAVKEALLAAHKTPSIKTFVLTSSSTAATRPKPNVKFHVDRNSWNEADIKEAWAETFTDATSRAWACYGASKTQGEQAVWEFVKEKKPVFSVNTVLPNFNFGAVLVPEHQSGSTSGWATKALDSPEGWKNLTGSVPPQYFVDVVDTARLHAAVLADPSYNGERLFAWAEPFNWNRLLAVARKVKPEKKTPEDIKDEAQDLSTVDNASAKEVLKKTYGQEGFVGFEQSVKTALDQAA